MGAESPFPALAIVDLRLVVHVDYLRRALPWLVQRVDLPVRSLNARVYLPRPVRTWSG